MNDYNVTTANGKHLSITADSTFNALMAALGQLKGYKLPVTVESAAGTGERLTMPDMNKGQLL